MTTLLLTHQAIDILAAIDAPAVQPPGTQQVQTILGWMKWLGFALAVFGLIGVGVMMMISHKGHGAGEHAKGLGLVFGGAILVGGAAGLIGGLGG